MEYYSKYKNTLEFESYLHNITNDTSRIQLTRFRLSAHHLAIETGRYNNIERNDRLCIFCNQKQIEFEYHFLLVCPKYIDIRNQLLPRYFTCWPSLNKFISLMKNDGKKVQIKLATFIKEAFKIRKLCIEQNEYFNNP